MTRFASPIRPRTDKRRRTSLRRLSQPRLYDRAPRPRRSQRPLAMQCEPARTLESPPVAAGRGRSRLFFAVGPRGRTHTYTGLSAQPAHRPQCRERLCRVRLVAAIHHEHALLPAVGATINSRLDERQRLDDPEPFDRSADRSRENRFATPGMCARAPAQHRDVGTEGSR